MTNSHHTFPGATLKKLAARATALALTLGVAAAFGSASASAAARPVDATHFADFSSGETPENIAAEPDGSVDVTFSLARQVARVRANAQPEILVTMPTPDDGGSHTPLLGRPVTMGLVRAQDGTLYFLYAAGDEDTPTHKGLTGVWRLRPHRTTPERIAPLPADSLPNGMALDPRSGMLYITDSAAHAGPRGPVGTVWTVPVSGGTATPFATDPALTGKGFGANGLKLRGNAVWVTNSAKGTILRLPILPGNRAGDIEVRATGLDTIDDFAFTGRGDEILAAVNGSNEVVRVRPDGSWAPLALTGLQNPTSLAIHCGTVYVASAAYTTGTDPNILTFPLHDEN
jgi:sugar lactone lactonase YvrE